MHCDCRISTYFHRPPSGLFHKTQLISSLRSLGRCRGGRHPSSCTALFASWAIASSSRRRLAFGGCSCLGRRRCGFDWLDCRQSQTRNDNAKILCQNNLQILHIHHLGVAVLGQSSRLASDLVQEVIRQLQDLFYSTKQKRSNRLGTRTLTK